MKWVAIIGGGFVALVCLACAGYFVLVGALAASAPTTPVGTRMPAPVAVEVLNDFQCERTSAGARITGKVKNVSGKTLSSIRIGATVRMQDNESLKADGFTFADSRSLAPGETTSFTAFVDIPAEGRFRCQVWIENAR